MRFLSVIPQEAHGIRLWISPFSSILRFLLLYCFWCFFSIYLQLYWQCKNVSQVVILTEDQVEKLLSLVWKRNAELLNLFCMLWKKCEAMMAMLVNAMAILWSYKKKKSINNDVDNVLVSQLLIKATYFLYGFNYLFCDVELCVLYGWRGDWERMMCHRFWCLLISSARCLPLSGAVCNSNMLSLTITHVM